MKEKFRIGSVEELSNYLSQFRIPINLWGTGEAKNISHLLSEIRNGDCELVISDDQLIRRVHFVNITVYAKFDGKKHQLIEDRQVFDEGSVGERIRRRRDLDGSVKEKIHSEEDPKSAVARAVCEELGISGHIRFVKKHSKDIDKMSPSFPGLRTQYRAHYFSAELKGSQIKRDGYKEVQPDKTTYFLWD